MDEVEINFGTFEIQKELSSYSSLCFTRDMLESLGYTPQDSASSGQAIRSLLVR